MSAKTTRELLEEVKRAGSAARGEEQPKSNKGSNPLKKLFSDYVYDLGTVAAPVNDHPEPVSSFPEPTNVEFVVSGDASNKSLEDIYDEAGITSQFSIDDLDRMVNSEEMKSQPVAMKQVAVPFALKAAGVTIEEPLMDAASRDAALDGYATTLSKRSATTAAENKAKEEAIDAEMKEFFERKQSEIEALRQDTARKEAEYNNFLDIKRKEEERMAQVIAPFLNGKANPVSVGNIPQDATITTGDNGKAVVKSTDGTVVGEQG